MSRNFHPLYVFRSSVLLGLILLIASFISYGILYFMINTESSYSGQSILDRIHLMVWFAMALYWIIGSFFILIVGLFATHKVAGPLYRLEMMLDEATAGRLPGEVSFRDGDQLQPLAYAQSVIFSYLILREREMAEHWTRVEKSLGALALGTENATSEEWSALAADLQSECSALIADAANLGGEAVSPPESLPGGQKGPRKGERGFTVVELTIVVAIVSILAAILFPLFVGLRDKAIWGAAKGNVATIRSALALYIANDVSNNYPASLTWDDMSLPTGFLHNTNLPSTLAAAKFAAMVYSTTATRNSFTLMVTVQNKFADTIQATPSNITPGTYPH
jgi:prepilin-type N-terminal cleavage/methylation domain-containing protein